MNKHPKPILMRARLHRWKYPALLALAVLFYGWEAIFSGRLFISVGSDSVNSILSSMVFFQDWARQGVFPWWNPLSMCGHTFGLNSISYPNLYHLLSLCVDAGTAYNWVTLTSFFLNGVFLYLFLVRKALSPYAAFVGALVWMISAGLEVDTGFFFLPLCFLLADRYASDKTRLNFTVLVLSILLYSLNANPQYFLYGGLFLFFYLMALERPKKEHFFWRPLHAAIPFALAAALGTFYFIPLFELAGQSNRSSWSLIQVLLPSHLLQAVFPMIFNSPTRPELDFMVPRTLQGMFSSSPHFKSVQSFIGPSYLGLLPVAGALVLVMNWAKQRRDLGRFFAGSAAFVLIYLGLHPFIYHFLVRHLPLLGGMTAVIRILVVYQFSMAVIAALAVDFFLRISKESKTILVKMSVFFAAMAAFFVGLIFLFKAVLVFFREFITERILIGLAASKGANPFAMDAVEFQKKRIDGFFYFFNELFSFGNPHVLMPLGLLIVLLGSLYFYQRGVIKARLFKFFLVLFILADLGSVLGFAHPSSAKSEIFKDSALADAIGRDRGLYRVMVLEDKTRSFHRMPFRPESNMIYGIATPDGYEQLYLKRYVRFYELLTKRKSDVGSILHTQEGFEKPLADFVNCKYVVTTAANPKLDGDPDYEKFLNGPEYKVFRNLKALPRFFAVHRQKVAAAEEILSQLKESPGILKEVVLLEGQERPSLDPSGTTGEDEIKVISYQPNKIEIECRMAREGYLVMSEAHYPGWKAWLDGHPASLELADYAFRAVRIGPGLHHLKMVYEPASFKAGILASFAGLTALGLILIFFKPRFGLKNK